MIASFILAGQTWVVARPGVTSTGEHSARQIAEWVNAGFAIGFVVVVVITIIEIGKQFYRLKTMNAED